MKTLNRLTLITLSLIVLTAILLSLTIKLTKHEEKIKEKAAVVNMQQPKLIINRRNIDYLQKQSLSLEDDISNDMQKVPPKKEIVNDLESMVAHEKIYYEYVLNEYKKAIKEYEDLSSNFDSMLRNENEIDYQAISSLDIDLQNQAQEIIRLAEQAILPMQL